MNPTRANVYHVTGRTCDGFQVSQHILALTEQRARLALMSWGVTEVSAELVERDANGNYPDIRVCVPNWTEVEA